MSAAVESDDSDAKRDRSAASGDEMFDLDWPLVTVSTLSIKDKKEISFSFASSKDLEKEISFS